MGEMVADKGKVKLKKFDGKDFKFRKMHKECKSIFESSILTISQSYSIDAITQCGV